MFSIIQKIQIKRYVPLILVVTGIVAVIVISVLAYNKWKGGSSKPATASQTQVISKTATVGKQFDIPLKNSKGEKTDKKLVGTLVSVERTNQAVISGKQSIARNGKIFILVNFEFDNKNNERISIAPKDYIRLVDEKGKAFAPNVSNTTVTVEPQAVRKDRVLFLVEESLKTFKLQIGEVTGSKELIQIKF